MRGAIFQGKRREPVWSNTPPPSPPLLMPLLALAAGADMGGGKGTSRKLRAARVGVHRAMGPEGERLLYRGEGSEGRDSGTCEAAGQAGQEGAGDRGGRRACERGVRGVLGGVRGSRTVWERRGQGHGVWSVVMTWGG
jgi:hypothetical protein